MYGLAGRTIRLDLTKMKYIIEPSENYAKFIGGRGVGSWILFNELRPDVHPYSPENLVIFSPGLLVGTGIPQADRTNVGSKNPNTNGIGYSNVGGSFGTQLKGAGFDNIIISGKAQRPVYLWISEGGLEIRDASHLWGRTTAETEDSIKGDLGDDEISVASIGPAGENLTFASAIIVEKGHAAGSAIASVMGSKNLKAIAVRGDRKVEVADPPRLDEVKEGIIRKIEASEFAKTHKTLGSYGRVLPGKQKHSAFTVRNYQDDYWEEEKYRKIDYDKIMKYRKEMLACSECSMPCINYLEIDEGKYAGTTTIGFHASAGEAFGPRFDIDDPEVIIKANAICNELGLDVCNAAAIISWAFELYEKGLIKREDCDGLELDWGNSDALLELLKKLAHREGFGGVLADGFRMAAAKIGKGSEYYAMEVKGEGILDPLRTQISWGFGVITSVRGSKHLDGASSTEARGYSVEAASKIFGVPTAPFPCTYEGKARLVFWFENFKAITDSLGICYFSTYWGNALELLGPEDYAEMYRVVTGERKSAEELMLMGWRIHEVEKAFNTLHANFTRKDDLPPMRVFIEPIKKGPFKGCKLDWNKYNEMLDEYYELHGWDRSTGWQKEEGLRKLGLSEVAEKLRRYGKLITARPDNI